MRLRDFLSKGFKLAARMVSVGLDEYTIYVFKNYEDLNQGHWWFKEIHTDHKQAVIMLDELMTLHGEEWFFTTDFESLV